MKRSLISRSSCTPQPSVWRLRPFDYRLLGTMQQIDLSFIDQRPRTSMVQCEVIFVIHLTVGSRLPGWHTSPAAIAYLSEGNTSKRSGSIIGERTSLVHQIGCTVGVVSASVGASRYAA